MANLEAVSREVSARAGISAEQAQLALEAFLEVTRTALARDGRVVVPGIGGLRVALLPAITGRDPLSGKPLILPERRGVLFSPDKELVGHVL